MKKYVFSILFFLGCFFIGLSIDTNLVDAAVTSTITTDAYDSRIIGIELNGLSPRTNKIKVQEVEYCEAGAEGCNTYTVDGNELNLKVLNAVEYTANGEMTATVTYTIVSPSDGEKYFLVETYQNATFLNGYSCFFNHKLSTLNQRIVINPDGEGKAMHVYDEIQYSSVRKLSVNVTLLEDEYDTYSGVVYICESTNCSDYVVGEGTFGYYINSFNDGLKQINIYLLKKDQQISENKDKISELTSKSQVISKHVYLDTTGPEITIEGGNWVWLEAGKTYTAQKATCSDSVFKDDACAVDNDLEIVRINYNTDKYQIVTYEASDRLGNIRSETVKIKVEIAQEESNITTYVIIAGAIFLSTIVILGYILIKNNEKKKKMSYI